MSCDPEIVHGTALRHAGKGLLLIGPSGSGKSTLALQLMGLGAGLIADDRVILTPQDDGVEVSCPATISGLIEAHGVGLLNAAPADSAVLALVVDLSQIEGARMPPQRDVTLVGHNLPLLWRVESPHFPATLLQILTHGRSSR